MELQEVKYKVEQAPDHYKFSKGSVLHYLNMITFGGSQIKPTHLKKGDIYVDKVGSKRRPCVIIKVCEEMVYSIPLSTTENSLNLCETKSRFLSDGFFSKSVACSTKEWASESFIGVYDNPTHLNDTIKLLRRVITPIF